MPPIPLAARLVAAAVLLSVPGTSQDRSILLRQGDTLPNTPWPIERFHRLGVSDSGIVLLDVELENPASTIDAALLRDGAAFFVEGDPISSLSDFTFEKTVDLDVNERGSLGWILDLAGMDITRTNDRAIFQDARMLVREDDAVRAAQFRGEPLPTGTRYEVLSNVKTNNDNAFLVRGTLTSDDWSFRDVAALLRTDGQGTVLEEEILLLEGEFDSRWGEPVSLVPSRLDALALANDGSHLLLFKVGPDPIDDSILALGDTILAREGDPAPLPVDPISGLSRVYTDLGASTLDLNDFGETVFTGYASGDADSNVFLVVNGNTVVQEGETLPAWAGNTFHRFDDTPVRISNSGDVYWYARANGDPDSDQYLMRNDQVIVQEGCTTVDGVGIAGLSSLRGSFEVCDSGRFWIAELRDESGDELIVMADFGASYPLHGCGSNPGSLDKTAGEARVGSSLELVMDGEQAPGTVPLLFLSAGSAVPGNLRDTQQCGLARSYGELMIDLAPGFLFGRLFAPPGDGSPVSWNFAIPNDAFLVGVQVYAQGAYYDVAGTTGTDLQLTNGFYIEVGAP